MNEHKNIDRLFQEKFRDFEVDPSDTVWKNIEKQIGQKPKKDRRVLWLWFSGIAAGLALFIYLNNPFVNSTPEQKSTSETRVKTLDNNTNTPAETELVVSTKEPKETPKTSITKTKSIATPTTPLATTNKPLSNKSLSNKPLSNKLQHIKEQIPQEVTAIKSHKTISKPVDKTIPNAHKPIKEENNDIAVLTSQEPKNTRADSNQPLAKTKPERNKKWSVSTVAAPVYLSSFDKNSSSIDPQFNNNTKQGSFSSAYGVQLAYQVSNKFILQSGVHIVDYGYKTYGVYVSPGGTVNHYSNINYNADANLIAVYAAPPQATPLGETNLRGTKGNLMQVFGYVEVPLEVKYRVNNGAFGINVVGGFSTLLLNKNQIFIETDGLSSELGEASNLNTLNFSGNLGLEFDYKLYQNLHFNLVPMFKVQTNTFEQNTGGFSPYAIGVYSGLNFRF